MLYYFAYRQLLYVCTEEFRSGLKGFLQEVNSWTTIGGAVKKRVKKEKNSCLVCYNCIAVNVSAVLPGLSL